MKNGLNKKELAELLADRFDITKKLAVEEVSWLFDEIATQLKNGNNVDISGFGKFAVKTREAHDGINPATLEKISIEKKSSVTFKAAKALKEKVN